MRVAALYDIHGNLPALEAVLEEVRREPVDRLVVGGDVFPGPMAREALARLRRLDIPVQFIRGNGEAAVLLARAGRDLALPEEALEPIRWCARQIDDEEERFLAGWPLSIALDVHGMGRVLLCHATPRDDNEIFTSSTPDERLAPAFASVDAPLVVCGHTHMPFDRAVAGTRVVNAGSVGMPFGPPGAHWLLFGPAIEWRRTPYDLAGAAERIRGTKYPQAAQFAARYVLDPPSAEEMLAWYARHDSKA